MRKRLLELKAARNITPEHLAQALNCLRATDVEVALILSFGEEASFNRLVFDNQRKAQHKLYHTNLARNKSCGEGEPEISYGVSPGPILKKGNAPTPVEV